MTANSALQYTCSNTISETGCNGDPETQRVTCYCTSNYCNYPLIDNERVKRMIGDDLINQVMKSSRTKRSGNSLFQF